VVSGLLYLQASDAGDPALSDRLNEASTRISTIGRAYERLAYNADYESIGLVSYLREVIDDLSSHLWILTQAEFMRHRPQG
jgi:two-component sensor histidine kinase